MNWVLKLRSLRLITTVVAGVLVSTIGSFCQGPPDKEVDWNLNVRVSQLRTRTPDTKDLGDLYVPSIKFGTTWLEVDPNGPSRYKKLQATLRRVMAGSRSTAQREWMSRRRAAAAHPEDPAALYASLLCTHLWLIRLSEEGQEVWGGPNALLVMNTNWMLARSGDSDPAIAILRLSSEIRNMIFVSDQAVTRILLEAGRRWHRAKPANYELRRILASLLAYQVDSKSRTEGDAMIQRLIRDRPAAVDLKIMPMNFSYFRCLTGKQSKAALDLVWKQLQDAKRTTPAGTDLAKSWLPHVERNLREMYQRSKLRPPSG